MTPEEEARAAELEARILAEERAADLARRGPTRDRRNADTAIYSSVPLAIRAAEEYGYVRRDIRRITIVGGALLGALAALWVLVNVANVV